MQIFPIEDCERHDRLREYDRQQKARREAGLIESVMSIGSTVRMIPTKSLREL